MIWLRRFAYVSALALLLGEPWRSIGGERIAYVWIDDVAVAALLIGSAIQLGRADATSGVSRRALFSGAWAAAAVILYNSFFEKLHGLHAAAGDGDRLLAAFLGVGFTLMIGAFWLSVTLPDDDRRRR